MIRINSEVAVELGEALIDASERAGELAVSIGIIAVGTRYISTPAYDDDEAVIVVDP